MRETIISSALKWIKTFVDSTDIIPPVVDLLYFAVIEIRAAAWRRREAVNER